VPASEGTNKDSNDGGEQASGEVLVITNSRPPSRVAPKENVPILALFPNLKRTPLIKVHDSTFPLEVPDLPLDGVKQEKRTKGPPRAKETSRIASRRSGSAASTRIGKRPRTTSPALKTSLALDILKGVYAIDSENVYRQARVDPRVLC